MFKMFSGDLSQDVIQESIDKCTKVKGKTTILKKFPGEQLKPLANNQNPCRPQVRTHA